MKIDVSNGEIIDKLTILEIKLDRIDDQDKIKNIKKEYDILHAHFIFPDGILASLVSKYTGIPFVITTHGSDVPGYNPDRYL